MVYTDSFPENLQRSDIQLHEVIDALGRTETILRKVLSIIGFNDMSKLEDVIPSQVTSKEKFQKLNKKLKKAEFYEKV